MIIQELYGESLKAYTPDVTKHQLLWNEIGKAYSSSKRHYHTIDHLDNLARELTPHREQFRNWDNVVFAIAYHDIVYDVLKNDNEERSADVAISVLSAINYPSASMDQCKQLILATKGHDATDDRDINLFVDADLSILGAESYAYQFYADQIRKEYSIYPDLLYKPGRRKVLEHFLKMPRIYKTNEFSKRYEEQAKANLEEELRGLNER